MYDQGFRFRQPTKSSFQRFLFYYFVWKLEILTIFSTIFQMKQLFVRGSCSAPVELLFSSCSAPKLLFGACSVFKQKGVEGLRVIRIFLVLFWLFLARICKKKPKSPKKPQKKATQFILIHRSPLHKKIFLNYIKKSTK